MKAIEITLSILFLLLSQTNGLAQKHMLQSGPMLGYSEIREVLIWAQTTKEAKVSAIYWEVGQPKEKFSTEQVKTSKAEAFTAKLIADQVRPGKKYTYQLLINDKAVKLDYPTSFQTQSLWQWRTDPPNFKMAIGSCAYINEAVYDRPGNPYGNGYEIFETIHQQRPDAMLWLGDNTYLREADWSTRTGIMHRYTHTRSLPQLQPLLASTHHYAIWDDHDFGPDNSDRHFVHKEKTLEAFRLFWGNPTFGLPEQKGITTFFQFNDIDFFLLDNRYHRSPNERTTGEATMLGEMQLEWLIDALVNSKAPFKMIAIGGQVLSNAAVYENYAHYHASERAKLLQRIEEENIKGVVFLSGDRHFSQLSHDINNQGNAIYEICTSPLTAGVAGSAEDNAFTVEGTVVMKNNFGILEFSGPREKRELTIRILDTNGQEQWNRTIKAY